MITNIPCIILSGGKSSRMGEDKSLLSFDNSSTIIEYQYHKLSQIFSDVYISSKTNKFNFDTLDIDKLILDTSAIYSPMIALKSILDKFKGKVFIITVDTPFVSYDTIKDIIDNSNEFEIAIAQSKNKLHNLCGVFSNNLLSKIDEYLKDDMHQINHLVRNSNTKIIDFKNSEQFLNINTKEDYNKALEQLI